MTDELKVCHQIHSVYPLRNFCLILEFEQEEYRIVDLRPLLWGPMFEPLKDFNYFKQVKVDEVRKTVFWPNEVDLDPDVLYIKSIPLVLPESNGGER